VGCLRQGYSSQADQTGIQVEAEMTSFRPCTCSGIVVYYLMSLRPFPPYSSGPLRLPPRHLLWSYESADSVHTLTRGTRSSSSFFDASHGPFNSVPLFLTSIQIVYSVLERPGQHSPPPLGIYHLLKYPNLHLFEGHVKCTLYHSLHLHHLVFEIDPV
jgi:hypothetical protein